MLLFLCALFFFSCFHSQDDNYLNPSSGSAHCYDFYYSCLSVDVSLSDKIIKGHNKLFFKTKCSLDTISIDLFSSLNVDSIWLNGHDAIFLRNNNKILIGCSIPKKTQFVVDIFYQGSPISAKNPPWEGGFVWSKDQNNFDWVGVACQKDGGRLWWPVRNDLSDEPDSMRINISVEKPYFAVSNGQLIDVSNNGQKRRFEWLVKNPINDYNVTMNIANYQNFQDTLHGVSGILDLDYYVLDYNLNLAKDHFGQVKPMLHTFEKLFGPYPFYSDGYKLVETSYLGMEHQSCISYGNQFMKGYLGHFPDSIDFDFIIIHESAHEWWGNSVSMKDQKDMWIHESFATYAEALYVELIYGYESMLTYLNYQKDKIQNKDPIISEKHTTTDMYYKGSWMLHTLRTILRDDDLWRDILKGLQKEFQHKTVNTSDITNYIEKQYGRDLDTFFEQYLFYSQLPIFEYYFTEINNNNFVNFRWNTLANDFDMPILAKVDSCHYNWIYPNNKWTKIELKGILTEDFKVAEELFLLKLKQVK